MIPQNQNNGRSRGRSNAGRPSPGRNYSRIPIVSDVIDMFSGGGGQPEMQTTTQQNLPSWAVPDAMSTLSMGNYYTQNPDYRASTLDRDYSGIRGGASGVGQFGLNPRRPALPGKNLDGTDPYRPNDLNNLVAQLPPDLQSPLNLGRGRGRSTGWFWDSDDDSDSNDSSDGSDWSWEVPQIDLPDLNFDSLVEDTWLDNRPQSDPGELAYPTSLPETPTQSPQGDIRPDGSNSEGSGYPTGNGGTTQTEVQQPSSENQGSNTNTQTNTTTTTQPTIDPKDIFNADDLTPFQAYDRQRFAAPGQNTVRGEGILAGRYDQRFGTGGTDPFAAANQAVGTAANYQSGFQGTTGGIGGQAGNYQANLANASNPGVFQSRDYTTGLPNFQNTVNLNAGDFQNVVDPSSTVYGNTNAGMTGTDFGNANQGVINVNQGVTGQTFNNLVNPQETSFQNANAGLTGTDFGNVNQGLTGTDFGNVNQGMTGRSYENANANQRNVNANLTNPLQNLGSVTFGSANQGLTSSTYGDANQGLQGVQNYNRGFQGLLNQSFNPFQDQVVNQTIKDLDRARQITNNEISGSAAKAGAFGGSREALMRAENNRNFFDRVGSAVGQLRSQGYESAANRASQENLQRLGLTASDVQNFRGLQSQGNLQGQSLSAAADQQLRGLQSQGNLQAQNLTASDRASARDLVGRGALQTQALQSQGGLQAQNLQAQGAQAAQGLTAQSDRQTQNLQSQGALTGQQLTAQDAQQVRSLISQAGLQGQNLTAADRQQLNSLISQGALQSQNLTAADRNQLNSLVSQGVLQGQRLTADSASQAAALQSQGALAAQGLQSQGALAGQQLTAQDAQQVRSLISQGGLQGQNLTAADRQQLNDLVSRGALQSQNLSAADRQQLNSLITQGALQSQNLNANLLNQALGLNAGMDRAVLQANAGLLSDAMGLDAADLQQRRNLASTEAQFAENALRNAGALNLSGGQALGQLAQAGTADERQRIADLLAAGQAGDARNQQDLDFIFNEFNRELDYPGRQIDLRNAAISPATGSIVTTTQPRYSSGGLPQAAGAGLATYGALAGIPAAAPYALPAAIAMSLLNY